MTVGMKQNDSKSPPKRHVRTRKESLTEATDGKSVHHRGKRDICNTAPQKSKRSLHYQHNIIKDSTGLIKNFKWEKAAKIFIHTKSDSQYHLSTSK